MGKIKKVDIRLTSELDAWLEAESKKLTLNKSSFARMILEQARHQHCNHRYPSNLSNKEDLRVAEDPE